MAAAGDSVAGAESAEELIALLEAQCALYGRLRELTVQQREAARTEDPSALLGLLGRRQEVLAELNALDERVRPIRQEWETVRRRLPDGARARAAAIFQETRAVLESILQSDREVSEELEARKTQTAAAISQIGQARRAHAAYGAPGSQKSQYFDGTGI